MGGYLRSKYLNLITIIKHTYTYKLLTLRLIMVKRNKILCLDDDLVEKLKTINASKLVNDLLRRHYDETDLNQMSADQIRKELKAIDIREKAEAEVAKLNGK